MTTKECKYCGEIKPVGEFTKNKGCLGGRENKCKKCTKAKKHEAYLRNKDEILTKNAKYRRQHPEKQAASIRKWRVENKEKYLAHSRLNHAIEKGFLEKPNACKICGSDDKPIHGHHFDYSKPLDVIWVCPQCHKNIHRCIEALDHGITSDRAEMLTVAQIRGLIDATV